ncbi:MAG TPA: DUF4301 family protein [Flavobacterium sp.]|jgi:hypothetical protein
MEENSRQQLELSAGFTAADFEQLARHGISLDNAAEHLHIYRNGIPKTVLDRPATAGDGIIRLSADEVQQAAAFFDTQKDYFKLIKFVPASGAASRMFKFLTQFMSEFNVENETINAYINRKKANELTVFFAGLEKFPFFNDLLTRAKEAFPEFTSWDVTKRKYHLIKVLLDENHFDFCSKPKGILPFHKYDNHIATPIEEHLKESVHYAASNGIARLHFTVSDHHQIEFEQVIENVKEFPEKHSGTKIRAEFSHQDPATDTFAVDPDNKPVRDNQRNLILRPGGHGALIQNLNNLDADIVFIKNIDNVIQDHVAVISLHKKALAGTLVKLQQQVFDLLERIESGEVADTDFGDIADFVRDQLNVRISAEFSKYTVENRLSHLKELLNRPIRVCGMVKNEGEPGGGPFWVKGTRGDLSLQIVETSQVDMKNRAQADIVAASTHFNPVDLVCGIRDYRGSKFNLNNYVNRNSGFIVKKNKNGKDLKAYELPGLWNGAMAGWITVFVEVPLVTFNPVKTVNDLLKPAHQPH